MRWTPSLKNAFVTSALFILWMHLVVHIIGGTLLTLVKPLPYFQKNMDLIQLVPQKTDTGWYEFVQPLQRFDGLWYKDVVLHHYKNDLRSAAFFPLFPLCVEFFMKMTGLSFEQVAFVFNTVLLFIFFALLYLLAEKENGKEHAWQTVAIYAFFPTSFFLLAPYAETLLLTLMMGALFFAYGKKYFLSAICAALAAATKPFGAFLFVALFIIFYKAKDSKLAKLGHIAYLSFIPLAILMVVLYQDAQTGITLSTFRAQNFWGIIYPSPGQMLSNIFTVFSKIGYDLPTHLDFILAACGILLLILSKGIIKFELWLFSLVFYLIFIFTSTRFQFVPFFSLSRYFLMLFPLLMFATTIKMKAIFKIWIVAMSIFLYTILFTFYSIGWFVA